MLQKSTMLIAGLTILVLVSAVPAVAGNFFGFGTGIRGSGN